MAEEKKEPNNESNQASESKKTPEKKKSNTKKILLWSFGITLAIFLVLIGITCWVLATIFNSQPLSMVAKSTDLEVVQQCSDKFARLLEKNQDDPNALYKDQTVVFSKKEVNKVLDNLTIGAREYLNIEHPDTIISDVRFEDGVLYADASQKVAFYNPFGQYVNMKLAIVPRIENKHLYLKVKSMKAGSIELSGDWVQGNIDKELRKFEETENGQLIVGSLKGVKLESDKVYITINPFSLSTLYTTLLLKMFAGGLGEEMGDQNSLQVLELLQQLQ